MSWFSKREKRAEPWADDAGLTLIELLVVLGILALIASLAAPQVLRYLGTAKVEATRMQIGNLESALELYHLDNGSYPPKEPGLMTLIEAPPQAARWNGPYIKKGAGALKDPWGNSYIYRPLEGKNGFEIVSLGRDGLPGGEGEDQDIKNTDVKSRN